MPRRKKNSSATADKPSDPPRRSTRTSRKTSFFDDDPLDNAATQNPTHIENPDKSIEMKDYQEEEKSNTINVRSTPAKSPIDDSPPTTDNGNLPQKRRVKFISTPKESEDVIMRDAGQDGEADELSNDRPASKKAKGAVREPQRKGKSKYDNPEEMLTNPRAPLANVNLRDLLCSRKAWEILSPEEKERVLSKFPTDGKEILDKGTENARPNIPSLQNNDNFRNDISQYQEHLRKGWHDPEWIRQAQAAHAKHIVGAYNEYLDARFEDDWGMPPPLSDEQTQEQPGSTIVPLTKEGLEQVFGKKKKRRKGKLHRRVEQMDTIAEEDEASRNHEPMEGVEGEADQAVAAPEEVVPMEKASDDDSLVAHDGHGKDSTP
ncbi:Asx homology domain-containing protein [Hypoxylon trugodes]|uniref:Asx homology domain-containing protein n=1 Tax=Hypoxylon trugodes TaxID=326681 RepID=UPI00219D92EF|nr:Asx homology domain-containing protein [Hypoxylon trugodes]KAI1390944.1 Asx homology domain-containing protein [Hypoxylon trugodes]